MTPEIYRTLFPKLTPVYMKTMMTNFVLPLTIGLSVLQGYRAIQKEVLGS